MACSLGAGCPDPKWLWFKETFEKCGTFTGFELPTLAGSSLVANAANIVCTGANCNATQCCTVTCNTVTPAVTCEANNQVQCVSASQAMLCFAWQYGYALSLYKHVRIVHILFTYHETTPD
jgi:hypothetical protein